MSCYVLNRTQAPPYQAVWGTVIVITTRLRRLVRPPLREKWLPLSAFSCAPHCGVGHFKFRGCKFSQMQSVCGPSRSTSTIERSQAPLLAHSLIPTERPITCFDLMTADQWVSAAHCQQSPQQSLQYVLWQNGRPSRMLAAAVITNVSDQ